MSNEYWSPPRYAKHLGVAPEKIIGWIDAGMLEAIDTSSEGTSRPRWKISPEARKAFEASRSNQRFIKPRRQRKRKPGPAKEFF